jgi:disulfide bond formation protein DsbB
VTIAGYELTVHRAVLAVFAVSLATIAGAWGFELAGYPPCPLCHMQRWAYYTVIPLTLVLFLVMNKTGLVRAGLVVCGLVMLAGGALGAYHAGVEWGFWPGPQSCAGGAGLSGGLPDLDKARVIRCDEAQLRILGLSFAGWNVVVSAFIAAIAFAGAGSRDHGSSSLSQ